MTFNSIDFLFFFPIVTLIYFVIPKRTRNFWLLIASYYFYMSWNPKYAILIAISTAVTFLSGLLLEKANGDRHKKIIVTAFSLIVNLAILGVFKYADFALQTLSSIGSFLGIGVIDKRLDLLLPVGISFYTFQALGYTIDVYRGTIKAEHNIVNYALFVSFFPQLVAGPIERSGNLLRQIRQTSETTTWNYERVRDGIFLMFWGLFQKMVIADRASILVKQVYGAYQNYGFMELFIASVLFSLQIYCDFGGYTDIARGAARVMGFSLMQNFKRPYFATSIKDFWQRWHISLTSWFRDYLYIPLGGNRKGRLRQYANILIVFGLSGLWHGASWHFVAWGLLHAIYLIAETAITRLKCFSSKAKAIGKYYFIQKLGKIIVTFILVDIAWIFFAVNGLRQAFSILKRMTITLHTTNIHNMGLDRGGWYALLIGLIALLAIDIAHEKGKNITNWVNLRPLWFREILYIGLVWGVILLGVYGVNYDVSQFIYFQF